MASTCTAKRLSIHITAIPCPAPTFVATAINSQPRGYHARFFSLRPAPQSPAARRRTCPSIPGRFAELGEIRSWTSISLFVSRTLCAWAFPLTSHPPYPPSLRAPCVFLPHPLSLMSLVRFRSLTSDGRADPSCGRCGKRPVPAGVSFSSTAANCLCLCCSYSEDDGGIIAMALGLLVSQPQ